MFWRHSEALLAIRDEPTLEARLCLPETDWVASAPPPRLPTSRHQIYPLPLYAPPRQTHIDEIVANALPEDAAEIAPVFGASAGSFAA